MQVRIQFADADHNWEALPLARLLCDIQHLCTVISNLPGNSHRDFQGAIHFNPKYQAMIMADVPREANFLIDKSAAQIISVNKNSPLTIVFGVFLSAGSVAAITAVVRAVCRIVLDMQRIRKEARAADRAALRALHERILLERDYLKLRNSLSSEDERLLLDASMASAMESLVDGRYPRVGSMKTVARRLRG